MVKKGDYRLLVEKPGGKNTGRPKRRCSDNIKIDLEK
jgi:hypothetical protein